MQDPQNQDSRKDPSDNLLDDLDQLEERARFDELGSMLYSIARRWDTEEHRWPATGWTIRMDDEARRAWGGLDEHRRTMYCAMAAALEDELPM